MRKANGSFTTVYAITIRNRTFSRMYKLLLKTYHTLSELK